MVHRLGGWKCSMGCGGEAEEIDITTGKMYAGGWVVDIS